MYSHCNDSMAMIAGNDNTHAPVTDIVFKTD